MSKLADLLNPLPRSRAASPPSLRHASPLDQSPIAPSDHNDPAFHSLHNDAGAQSFDEKGADSDPSHQNDADVVSPKLAREDSAPGVANISNSQRSLRRPSESFADLAAPTAQAQPPFPVEPTPFMDDAQKSMSPTLEQYHHSAGSPSHDRRPEPPPSPTRLPQLQHFQRAAGEQSNSANTPRNDDHVGEVKAAIYRQPYAKMDVDHDLQPSRSADAHVGNTAVEPEDGNPDSTFAHASAPSPQPQVKLEPSATSPEPSSPTPTNQAAFESSIKRPPSATPMTDVPTPKEVAELRESSIKPASTEASPSPRGTPTANLKAQNKKSNSSKSGSSKKGPATSLPKNQNKKAKLDPGSKDGTPSSKRSATPASSRASKTPAARNAKPSSSLVGQSSNNLGDEEDDGTEVFCICRRPDNHTWMIGCDGGCEDWFHGACVDIEEEDGDLIDKYICPNCAQEGKGNTTWKPMCRLKGCRQPARLAKKNASKYCSDEHGREFMEQHLHKKSLKRKRSGKGDTEEASKPAVGGALSPSQLAAMSKDAKDIGTFRSLGEGVLSPPPTVSPESDGDGDTKMEDADAPSKDQASFNQDERNRLSKINREKDQRLHRRQLLKDREKFVQLVRARAKRVLDELKGVKDICGFDSRLSWTDEEFSAWLESDEAREAIDANTLGPPPRESADDPEESDLSRGVCPKKRCERHKQWWTLQLQDLRFEDTKVTEDLERLSRDEQDLKDRAKLRRIKEAEGDREGRVEVVA
ncbi:MAG: hypothetical protein M4579_006615 [Chaenotheca gracillima]|nr:MAG: hypothetical protein M4579_006615 [Chaenotheca gracillima]